ncbi:glycosyltransferase [Paenibacillus sp. IB182496]|uniref:4,4'-diaponeurosporenoate glycosyltransferase n=2 Tax=Paenibacillus sabuli TaxID=2772509 RepID=A0A927GUF3_9BACL|nr:glycosyltransferase [Paenibacillus sabuli]
MLPTEQRVGAVVTVMNEQETIGGVLAELQRLPLTELIVVINGSRDASYDIVRSQTDATIVHTHAPLGHDVGRALGAKLARADVVLFLDGDIPVKAEELVPFALTAAQGSDIVLNDISPYVGRFEDRDAVTMVKEFVNRVMGRGDLGINSLTAVPHAMRSEAIARIGHPHLAVPPKAQVLAMLHGLVIRAAASVDVIAGNRTRAMNTGQHNPVAELIVGDHLEALHEALTAQGKRMAFPDPYRRRVMTMA